MSDPQQTEKKPKVFTDRLRGWTGGIIKPIGSGLYRMGVHPDMVTAFGLLIVAVAAVFIGKGQLQLGGVLLLIGLPLDALDGAVARAMQRKGRFGIMLDSTLDRYADGFIFAALSYYFAVLGRFDMLLLAQAALLGSILVSYARARAEGIGVNTKIGLFTRVERVTVIIIMLLAPRLLDWGVLILAVGTNFTAMQRLWFVYNSLKNEGN
ncbi:MAG: CDP-alcohol phosphatidyltransferase family protein [Anaerolineae bacterium]|nr:CDP-alcohol phosphatidyltransferase family protein [Anaerolineae bacterium]